ncbi:GHKL domain-containing protein [Flexibacter flexilis DSM 6793]|uniref:GHKL domain-containing protein n=1 Tax=Flexibacter flexilis DSM 6793 TaxID=927664 RepID=A0A1I1E9R2_9BACT|nr:sensor histidine kinase [Flexibacter flexilis]SFB81713.1 GHKL domain-containing protein [Flexibacter flexilis DSM 6793]
MNKSTDLLIQIAFWIFYTILLLIVVAAATNGFAENYNLRYIFKVGMAFVFLPSVSGFYLFYVVLFPKYIKTKKVKQSLTGALITALFLGLLSVLFVVLLFGYKMLFNQQSDQFFFKIISMMAIALATGLMGVAIKGFVTWYDEMRIKEALTLKNHQIELALVKSQLDPHFLFNTINNIDVLILKDAQIASVYLNKLSDILRFMLYETKQETIPLSREIEYIQQYIALQKIRTSNTNFVTFSVIGDTNNHTIAPMALITFVENAFKHSTNKKEPDAIVMTIRTEEKNIYFECKNKFNPDKKTEKEYNGLGQNLIQKRLEFIYKHRHKLEIKNKNNIYTVKLLITHD